MLVSDAFTFVTGQHPCSFM